jgi:hypothetical protein
MEAESTLSIFVDVMIIVGVWGGTLGYPILQYLAIKRMSGVWRVFAYLPLIPMAVVIVVTVILLSQESNIWPVVLIFVSPVILVYLLFLLVLHYLIVRRRVPRED